jgi:alkylation response protein AidB-like acyl-CoA dehydrogenase
MKTPGIEVKPIITIDGEHEVNSVFFTDVKVPAENIVGEEGKGWTYAKFLLAHERFGIAAVGASMRELSRLKDVVKELDSPELDKKVAEVELSISALELTELRLLSALENGGNPGAESSILKIKGTEIQQRLTEIFVEAAGEYALNVSRRSWIWIK